MKATMQSIAKSEEEKRLESLKFKIAIRKFLNNYFTVIFTTLLTIYALFFDDIRIIAVDK
jgi:DNA-binding XRE family transcriptional regulator